MERKIGPRNGMSFTGRGNRQFFHPPSPPRIVFCGRQSDRPLTNSIIAGTDARSRGYDDALLLDTGGYVAEGPGANFFMEKDQVLYTPPSGHILPGITRFTILKLCREHGITVLERNIHPLEL